MEVRENGAWQELLEEAQAAHSLMLVVRGTQTNGSGQKY